jgi:predicted RNase H-like nuclease (RuvC/YqgF family)
MNIERIINSPWFFLVLVAIMLVCTIIGLLVMQIKRIYRDHAKTDTLISSLQRHIETINKELERERENRKEFDLQLKTIGARQRQMDLREPQAVPYSHAITMVKSGAAVNDVISTCGLSQGEAELIVAIHGSRQ